MRKALLILLLATLLIPAGCQAEKSAVLVIIDGMGSSYIYPEHTPVCVDGSPLPGISTGFVGNATARYDLWVPTPETESGNAVIATGYSKAAEEMLSYYGATVYDVLRANGYLSMAIMETGDTTYMIAKPDVIVYERNNSVYDPSVRMTVNGKSIPAGLGDLLAAGPPPHLDAGTDPAAAYRQYDDWSLGKAISTIQFMSETCPGQKYLLVVNAAGPDMAAHERGFDSYRQAIEDLDARLSSLAGTCLADDVALLVTADHGMSFKSPGSKGSHASGEASMRNESRLAPLLVFTRENMKRPGTYGQECVAPTLLSLMGCPDALSMENGEPVTVSDSSSLHPVSVEPALGWKWDWLPYAAIAAISALGLAAALLLMKRR
jgi:2,3-bisphosphoglycerate-independent phosphoglycerate mutase